MVRMRGLEPPRCHHHRLLRPARLPVPPHPRDSSNIRTRSRGVNSLPEPNSYPRSIVTPGPIIPVITIIITISRVGPGVRVPVCKVRLRVSIRVVLIRIVRVRIVRVRIVRLRVVLVRIVRLRIAVRVSPVAVVWLLIDRVRPLVVINYDATAMWSNDNPSSLTHRRDRQHYSQNERAHRPVEKSS